MDVARLSEQAWEQGLQLDEMRTWNAEHKPEQLIEAPHEPHKVRALTINVTQICNLHCSYCAAGGDGSFGDPVKKISIEKTLPQLQFFMKKLSAGDEFRLTFLGGEPLLYAEGLRLLALYAQELAADRQIKTQFVVVTNGTQFTRANIEILKQIKANITISIDGPPEINDPLRPNKGRSTSRIRIEPLALRRQLAHLFRRLETPPKVLVFLQLRQHVRQADRIRPAQDAAAERWEADAQNQTHVHIARLAHDPLAQHSARLRQHG